MITLAENEMYTIQGGNSSNSPNIEFDWDADPLTAPDEPIVAEYNPDKALFTIKLPF